MANKTENPAYELTKILKEKQSPEPAKWVAGMVRCPHCRWRVWGTPGKTDKCQNCGQLFTIPPRPPVQARMVI